MVNAGPDDAALDAALLAGNPDPRKLTQEGGVKWRIYSFVPAAPALSWPCHLCRAGRKSVFHSV